MNNGWISSLAVGFALAGTAAAIALEEVTATHLPQRGTAKFSMGAEAADLDGDGDLDLVIAQEYAANSVLFNSGGGVFIDLSAERLGRTGGDHEDLAAADFDGDHDIDLLFVGEDDQVFGYHINAGCGHFEDQTSRLPVRSTANAVVAGDFDVDGDADAFVGNNGQDVLLVNDGRGNFAVDTTAVPVSADVTQDVAAGDVEGDGDLDLLLGNEDGNALLINDGAGRFADETAGRLPLRINPEETRDADLADVDGDGDLDAYFANVRLFVEAADPQDRLLLNTGNGRFVDVTASHLPIEFDVTTTAGFLDLDADGDLDMLTGTFGDRSGRTWTSPYRAFLNDGRGRFALDPQALAGVTGNGFDIEIADFDGDGRPDAFLASRGGPDRLLLSGQADSKPAEEIASSNLALSPAC